MKGNRVTLKSTIVEARKCKDTLKSQERAHAITAGTQTLAKSESKSSAPYFASNSMTHLISEPAAIYSNLTNVLPRVNTMLHLNRRYSASSNKRYSSAGRRSTTSQKRSVSPTSLLRSVTRRQSNSREREISDNRGSLEHQRASTQMSPMKQLSMYTSQ